MRVVVTGALGHIGSRLVDVLNTRLSFAEVVMVDNLSARPFRPLSDLTRHNHLRFRYADIRTADLCELFSGADAVVHLAAVNDAEASFSNTAELEATNYDGTRRVAEACVRTRASLVFVSTTSVYATNSGTVDEDCADIEMQPQSPYAASKLRCERMLQSLAREAGLRHVVCRFGTIFGPSPGMKFHTAVNKFCRQAVAGLPVTVWRTALHQQRPYLELGDAVNALSFCLRRRLFEAEVFNVVTLNLTVSQILREISVFVPSLTIGYVDSPAMNQLSFSVERRRITRLGFEFTGSLRQGVGDTIEALRCLGLDAKGRAVESRE